MTTVNVAVLFSDIVGSTELSQRLSAEAADEVRRGHFAVLRQSITEAGGTEVKNLGDGLMVVFNSASAALGCAVAMQQGVDQDNRGAEYAVGLRVGLSVGEASNEDGDYFGDPVVEAARLCARCETGQILATGLVKAMAGRRNRHECRSVGELTLKGLPDPVEAVEVTWESLGGDGTGPEVPLPARLAVRPAMGVVGREAELAVISDGLNRVAAGEGREILLISGEAGLGKTTLVGAAAQAAFGNGACTLFGHCEEDLATPYQLFAEALGHFVTHAPEDQLLAHVEASGSELLRLVPALASRIPDLPPSKATDSDGERFLLFAAVIGLLTMVSEHQPVVLVIDDLQWADKGSLLLLRHLAAAEQAMRVLIIGTYRGIELSQTHPLTDALAALHRQSGVFHVDLVGLDDRGVMALLEATAGHTLDDAGVGLANAVYQETDGNPFFVSEVLRHLFETGTIFQDGMGRWTAKASLNQIDLPISVRTVIGARVGRLGNDAGRVLSVASVIGRDFDLGLLARTTETTEDDLLDILEAAAAAALVREPVDASGHYNFAHALIQHTLYEDMGPNRQAKTHRQVAEALEDLCGDHPGIRVGELARHWSKATHPIDLVKAIGYSRLAGDDAIRALAPDDALQYYAQALALYAKSNDPDPVLAIDLAIGLGTAQRQSGDFSFRDTLLDAAHQAADINDTDRLVAAALANDRGFVSSLGSIDTDKVEVLELALARLPSDHPDRALVLATLCEELTYGSPLERRQALAEEALAIAASSDDETTKLRVLNQVSLPHQVPPLLDQSLSWTAEALVLAERVGDPVLLYWAANHRLNVSACAGFIGEMDRCLKIVASAAERLDRPTLNWVDTYVRATRAMIAGDTDLAERLANQAFQIGTDGGEPDRNTIYSGQILIVSWQRGNIGELVALIEQAIVENPGLPAFVAALALALVEDDRINDARQLLVESNVADFNLPMDQAWLTGMTLYAEAAIECRDRRAAATLAGRLAPFADQMSFNPSTAEGPVSHFLGGLATVLGHYDEAHAHFAQSAAFCDLVGAKFFAARTQLQWGKLLLERQTFGDTEMARDLLASAHTLAVAHGYGTVKRRAATALQGLG
jgi:class 3 adenylate cyclase